MRVSEYGGNSRNQLRGASQPVEFKWLHPCHRSLKLEKYGTNPRASALNPRDSPRTPRRPPNRKLLFFLWGGPPREVGKNLYRDRRNFLRWVRFQWNFRQVGNFICNFVKNVHNMHALLQKNARNLEKKTSKARTFAKKCAQSRKKRLQKRHLQ